MLRAPLDRRGRYSEQFTTYYAHMSDTRVRRGDAVVAGTVLGQVGTTGASSGEHLHIAVFRNKNLSYRATFELDYSRKDFFELGKELASIDPWGWAPKGVDPWAWRFKFNDGDLPDDAGSWSIDLEGRRAPTMN
jgi:murein DD-endopeptidase MepM/ murein hydrolase activator NlpD